jgi:hypothetical protein
VTFLLLSGSELLHGYNSSFVLPCFQSQHAPPALSISLSLLHTHTHTHKHTHTHTYLSSAFSHSCSFPCKKAQHSSPSLPPPTFKFKAQFDGEVGGGVRVWKQEQRIDIVESLNKQWAKRQKKKYEFVSLQERH